MTKRVARTPPLVYTGYELTNALRRYLEVGHGVNFDRVKSAAIEEYKDLWGDEYNEADEEALAPEREAVVVRSYQRYFARVRRGARAEVRKALEIPYRYHDWIEGAPKIYMFVPTGAHIRGVRASSELKTLCDSEDLKVIQEFIAAANSLLPEAVRDEASLKLEDLQFEAHTSESLLEPVYTRSEREELLPPRYLRAFSNVKPSTTAHASGRGNNAPEHARHIVKIKKPISGLLPLVCTGYELTDALRKYLEIGHDVDYQRELSVAIEQDRELWGDQYNDADEETLAPQRAAEMVTRYRDHFRSVRVRAPAGVRKALEIPYMYFTKDKGAAGIHLFIPTGAYALEQYKSGALRTPPEADLEAIQAFMDNANSLLPEAVRDEAGFKLEDMDFEVHTAQFIVQPPYSRDEREELYDPPRHLLAWIAPSDG
ncbi:hypothetical protein BD311DRAFT_689054 [Dichomitus squalens]|uniref:Uncharacterized protein n=1 Tax=Dichomitus squalens TaxID=114155 RepID=A0A4Q9MXH1_9APHY|nr:hypothetical protein BD311DRAFT_689054 [Dichomitus squalens]